MNSDPIGRKILNPVSLARLNLNPSRLFRAGLPTILEHLTDFTTCNDSDQVCLTFDDGPDPVHTPRILDVLAECKTRASFFVLGAAAERYPQLIERMLAEGHTVGNHTFSHCHPWTISADRARKEVADGSKILRDICGNPPRWFRPPHGRLRRAMLRQVEAENMRTVLWSHSVIDWGPMGTDAGIAQRLNGIRSGDIVLMHDGKRQHNHPQITAQQLPEAIDWLTRQGIVPVTLDQVA